MGNHWNTINLGAIPFARDLSKFRSSIVRKAVRFVVYDGLRLADMVTHRQDQQKGYAKGLAQYGHTLRPLCPSLPLCRSPGTTLVFWW